MDKEIKYLLEEIKDNTYDYVGTNGCLYQDLSREELNLLLEYISNLQNQVQKQKEVIDKATNELFILKDMIYKPETREENFEIQRKISSIIKRLNGKEVE